MSCWQMLKWRHSNADSVLGYFWSHWKFSRSSECWSTLTVGYWGGYCDFNYDGVRHSQFVTGEGIHRLEFSVGRANYEESGYHHEHLVDIETDAVIEFHMLYQKLWKRKLFARSGVSLLTVASNYVVEKSIKSNWTWRLFCICEIFWCWKLIAA